jgi:hypothetical protein
MIRDLIAVAGEMLAKARTRRAARKLAERKARIAREYNVLHTHTTEWRKDRGRWMCPSCHEVHRATGWTFLTGTQYPACCIFAAGHRVYL